MLVTLKSENHENGSTTNESASNFTNHFREGIQLNRNSTAQLVSCSINKNDDYVVISGVNDTFYYSLGTDGPTGTDAGPLGPFSQHKVTIPAGAYSGRTLAKLIQQQLNSSTLLGCFRPYEVVGVGMQSNWSVIYTPATGTDKAKFLIANDQIPSGENFLFGMNTISQTDIFPGAFDGEWSAAPGGVIRVLPHDARLENPPPTFNMLGGDKVIGVGNLLSDPSNPGYRLKEGIFCNGGSFETVFNSVNVIGKFGVELVDALGGGDCLLENWFGSGIDADGVFSELPPDAKYNGYEYKLVVELGVGQTALEGIVPLVGGGGIMTGNVTAEGTVWAEGDEGAINLGTGAGATFKVTEVDPVSGGLVAWIIMNPGANYVVGDVVSLANPNGLGTDADGTIQTVSADFLGTNLEVAQDNLAVVAVFSQGLNPPAGASAEITSVGAGGTWVSSMWRTEGLNFTPGDIIYFDNPLGENPYFTVTTTVTEAEVWFVHVNEQGGVGITEWDYPEDQSDPVPASQDATDSTTWDLGFKLGGSGENWLPPGQIHIDNETRFFQINLPSDAGNDGATGALFNTLTADPNPNAIRISRPKVANVPVKFPVLFTFVYPETTLGYVRNQLTDWSSGARYDQQTPDMSIKLTTTSDLTGCNISVTQLQSVVGKTAFNAGWSEQVTVVTEPLINRLPGFVMGDWIKLSIKIDAIREVWLEASHDTQGNSNFVAPVIIALTNSTPMPNGGTLRSTIRECFYPLRPIIYSGLGTGFANPNAGLPGGATNIYENMATPYITGLLDTTDVPNEIPGDGVFDTGALVTGTSMDDSLFDLDHYPAYAPATTQVLLPHIFKFGRIRDTEIQDFHLRADVTDDHEIWYPLVEPNLANIQSLLAMHTVDQKVVPVATVAVVSDPDTAPIPDKYSPTIQIELPDFNIRSFSGASSDTGNAIAVIPKEQFTTDETTGTLHYESSYPVVIDLNCRSDIVMNQISVRLRTLDGRLADLLETPTQVTILIKDKEAAAQATALAEALDRRDTQKANRQSENIAIMNTGNVPFF
jgi:hypothetical protein